MRPQTTARRVQLNPQTALCPWPSAPVFLWSRRDCDGAWREVVQGAEGIVPRGTIYAGIAGHDGFIEPGSDSEFP